jgi:hypothetical protein
LLPRLAIRHFDWTAQLRVAGLAGGERLLDIQVSINDCEARVE